MTALEPFNEAATLGLSRPANVPGRAGPASLRVGELGNTGRWGRDQTSMPESVADVVVRLPKAVLADARLAAARAALDDDHVHMVLLTHEGRLVGTILRGDLPDIATAGAVDERTEAAAPTPSWPAGRFHRTFRPGCAPDHDPPGSATARRGR